LVQNTGTSTYGAWRRQDDVLSGWLSVAVRFQVELMMHAEAPKSGSDVPQSASGCPIR
jgi:hypothetical protein